MILAALALQVVACIGPHDCEATTFEVLVSQPAENLQRINIVGPTCTKEKQRVEIYVDGEIARSYECRLFDFVDIPKK